MFKKSKEKIQLDMLSGVPGMLEGVTYDYYMDSNGWHNEFREYYLKFIDETIFKVLYSEGQGAPNSSIKMMLGMMSMKEGFGWSDAHLFEQARYNVLVRSALGLYNLTDSIVAASTYYAFRKKVGEHEEQTGENLIEKSFQNVTAAQVKEFNVNGTSVRMDSKLIGSNIGYYSRYEIIHETLRMFYKNLSPLQKNRIGTEERKEIELLIEEKGSTIVYRSTKAEIETKLRALGLLIWKLLTMFPKSNKEPHVTLHRVFEDQFKVEEGDQVVIKNKKEILSTSVQSPHDTDCTFRNKKEQKVKGYHANLTETCDDGSPNLITNAQMAAASVAENKFVIEALEKTEKVLGHKVKNCHSDGAYHSQDNDEYCKENDIDFYLTGLQGAQGQYDLLIEENKLTVTDTKTGENIPASLSKSGKWKIKTDKGPRYFEPEEIACCQLRKQIAACPNEIKYKRNNVEATIFQLCFHSRNNKTRYRGLFKNKVWMFLRCLWINLVRIGKFIENSVAKSAKSAKSLLVTLKNAIWAVIAQIRNERIKVATYFCEIFRFPIRLGKIINRI